MYATKYIFYFKLGEDIITYVMHIEQNVVHHCEYIFGLHNGCINDGLIDDVIPNHIYEADKNMLYVLPTLCEVQRVKGSFWN